jgi:hypothetical protein
MELQLIQKILDSLKNQKINLEDAILTGSVEDWNKYQYLTGQYNMLLSIQRDIRDILEKAKVNDDN